MREENAPPQIAPASNSTSISHVLDYSTMGGFFSIFDKFQTKELRTLMVRCSPRARADACARAARRAPSN